MKFLVELSIYHKKTIKIGTVLLVFMLGIAFYLYRSRTQKTIGNGHTSNIETSVTKSTTTDAPGKAPVASFTVEPREMKRSFVTQTFLLPWKEVIQRPMPMSLVRGVHVKVGDNVKADTVLVSLGSESQKLRSELDKIDGEIRNIDYTVTRALARQSFLSKREAKQRELEHKAAQIRLKLNQLDNSAVIKSPIDGIVSELTIKVGDYIDQSGINNSLVKIVDKTKMRVQIYLPTEVAVQVNDKTKIFFRKMGASQISKDNAESAVEETSGVLNSLSPSVDLRTGTVFSETVLTKMPKSWLPGMFVEVEFVLEEAKHSLAIPREAIVYENAKPFVYIIKSQERGPASPENYDFAKKVEIELGMKDDIYVEIKKGIEELAQIVTEGQGALTDGAKVDVVK